MKISRVEFASGLAWLFVDHVPTLYTDQPSERRRPPRSQSEPSRASATRLPEEGESSTATASDWARRGRE